MISNDEINYGIRQLKVAQPQTLYQTHRAFHFIRVCSESYYCMDLSGLSCIRILLFGVKRWQIEKK